MDDFIDLDWDGGTPPDALTWAAWCALFDDEIAPDAPACDLENPESCESCT